MTERHSERHLEDWICDNWDDLGIGLCLGEFIGRQVPLQNGICDILSVRAGIPVVTELKIGKLKEQDIGQLLRYAGDVKRYLRGWAICHENFSDFVETNVEKARKGFNSLVELGHQMPVAEAGIQNSMCKILIGESVDSKIIASAEGADVEIYTYEYLGDVFTFEKASSDWAYRLPVPEWIPRMSREIVGSAQNYSEAMASVFYKSLFQKQEA